jgi:DNA-binding Xre family transcriptional regulator
MKLRIKEVAEHRGFKNAKALADAMSDHFGVRISYATIYPLWNDEAKLWARDTIDKLCSFLNVPAGYLIEHHPGESQRGEGPPRGEGGAKTVRRKPGRTRVSKEARPALVR